jgi:hypothetical protein
LVVTEWLVRLRLGAPDVPPQNLDLAQAGDISDQRPGNKPQAIHLSEADPEQRGVGIPAASALPGLSGHDQLVSGNVEVVMTDPQALTEDLVELEGRRAPQRCPVSLQ